MQKFVNIFENNANLYSSRSFYILIHIYLYYYLYYYLLYPLHIKKFCIEIRSSSIDEIFRISNSRDIPSSF